LAKTLLLKLEKIGRGILEISGLFAFISLFIFSFFPSSYFVLIELEKNILLESLVLAINC